jgi:hypothetical protein
MKKSRKPSTRINKAVKELKNANRFEIGPAIFEEIITRGIISLEDDLRVVDRSKNHIIAPELMEAVIAIIKIHVQLTRAI